MLSKVKVLVFLLIPVLLWGWGNDVEISTIHSSDYRYPVAYDMIWPNDTLCLLPLLSMILLMVMSITIYPLTRDRHGQAFQHITGPLKGK